MRVSLIWRPKMAAPPDISVLVNEGEPPLRLASDGATTAGWIIGLLFKGEACEKVALMRQDGLLLRPNSIVLPGHYRLLACAAPPVHLRLSPTPMPLEMSPPPPPPPPTRPAPTPTTPPTTSTIPAHTSTPLPTAPTTLVPPPPPVNQHVIPLRFISVQQPPPPSHTATNGPPTKKRRGRPPKQQQPASPKIAARGIWTAAEEQEFEQIKTRYGKARVLDWPSVVPRFPGRTLSALRHKWLRHLGSGSDGDGDETRDNEHASDSAAEALTRNDDEPTPTTG